MIKRTVGTALLFVLLLLTVVALQRTPMTPVGSAAASNTVESVKPSTN